MKNTKKQKIKYTVYSQSLCTTTFEIEADSREEAEELVKSGEFLDENIIGVEHSEAEVISPR